MSANYYKTSSTLFLIIITLSIGLASGFSSQVYQANAERSGQNGKDGVVTAGSCSTNCNLNGGAGGSGNVGSQSSSNGNGGNGGEIGYCYASLAFSCDVGGGRGGEDNSENSGNSINGD